uniref:Putative small heat shock protein n=1 Tax=Panstrongylus lignarius TaxID=156445 RepID=A0A224XLK9_9HEMI
MPLLPLLLNELVYFRRPNIFRNLYARLFDMEIFNDEEAGGSRRSSIMPSPVISNYIKLMKNLLESNSSITELEADSNEFAVNVDVQQFRPEEIKVSVVGDFLVVEGKHEERPDPHGFISRQFTRRYKIPEDVDKAAIVSNLSADGVLTLKAPKQAHLQGNTVREIPIIQTHAPAMKTKRKESM